MTRFCLRAAALLALAASAQPPSTKITVDYPSAESVFPPEFPPPTFLWRDPSASARLWVLEAAFANTTIRAVSTGPRLQLGPIDPRAAGPTNAPPALTPEQAAAHAWKPADTQWADLQRAARGQPVTLRITGFTDKSLTRTVSQGEVTFRFSTDPVGAPIFYRDVPLMPSETEKGVIKPLATNALPLIAWRLRDTRESASRLLLEGMHTCANCHSFSADGKTLGMDLDGPQNDKGLYVLKAISRQTAIRSDDVIAWSTFRGKLGGKLRVGFMSQVSPDGRQVVTTINDPGADESEYQRRKNLKEVALNYYVANFKDYRFLQVFYPTRGILAWYNRETGKLQPLPGADDPRYVHTNAVWSPDGESLVFARAEARDPYEPGKPMAARANDPNETPLQYGLYRIPFDGGLGGRAEPIKGASGNTMSNSFPKLSPDGRWLVFVQSRNGLLMRPDSKLFIMPAQGGTPRLMRCNTPLMNSWHSFSPNGRWMVFSSKSRSPYTQMFLTHIDENGDDSPAVLIENATAGNRAVNLPEFVNLPSGGWQKLDVPAADYYRVIDDASNLMAKSRFQEAVVEWRKALDLNPDEARPHNNLGYCLAEVGRHAEAVPHYERAIALSPEYPEAYNNLGEALIRLDRRNEAMDAFEKALRLNPRYASAHSNLGAVLAQSGRLDPAIEHFQQALAANPALADVHNNLAVALAMSGRLPEAIPHLEAAVRLTSGRDRAMLNLLAGFYRRAITAEMDPRMKRDLEARLGKLTQKR